MSNKIVGSPVIRTNAKRLKLKDKYKAQTTNINNVQIGTADVNKSHISKVSNHYSTNERYSNRSQGQRTVRVFRDSSDSHEELKEEELEDEPISSNK